MGIFGALFGQAPAATPSALVPVLANISPTPSTMPGTPPSAFSVDFRVARLQRIQFDVLSITPGSVVTAEVSFGDRNEAYTIVGADGVFRWPFDVVADNSLTAGDPGHVRLLPRGGWPPTIVTIRVATSTPTA